MTGLVDAHVHLVDFLQESAGTHALLSAMDSAGVAQAVVFGLPYKKRWAWTEPSRPTYYLDDESRVYPWVASDREVLELADAAPRGRLAVTVNGVDPTDLDAADRVDALLESGGFAGVGELLLRHSRLSAHVATEPVRANYPAVRRIVDVCERHGVTLAVHQNAGSTGQGPLAFVPELEDLLGWQSSVPVVWCHAGMSGEYVAPPVETMRRLLGGYRHLHIDLSWSVLDGLLDHDDLPHQWVETIAEHPDRFVWGSDSLGRFDRLTEEAARANRLLDRLPPPVRDQVGGENARRLWFGEAR